MESIKKELGSFFSTEAHQDNDIYRYINSAITYIRNYRDYPFMKVSYSFMYTNVDIETTIPYNIKTYLVK